MAARGRKQIWILSHCAQKISDSSGLYWKDLGQPLWAGFQLYTKLCTFGQPLLQAMWTNYTKSHLFIFLLCISAAQQVYTGEINVTLLWKGKTNAGMSRINHLSQRSSWGLLCVCNGEKSMNESEGVNEGIEWVYGIINIKVLKLVVLHLEHSVQKHMTCNITSNSCQLLISYE